MFKTGELKEGTTPCEMCGRPSSTVVDGMYLCEHHADQVRSKLAAENVIPGTIRPSVRTMIHALEESK